MKRKKIYYDVSTKPYKCLGYKLYEDLNYYMWGDISSELIACYVENNETDIEKLEYRISKAIADYTDIDEENIEGIIQYADQKYGDYTANLYTWHTKIILRKKRRRPPTHFRLLAFYQTVILSILPSQICRVSLPNSVRLPETRYMQGMAGNLQMNNFPAINFVREYKNLLKK